ncbi:MAG: lipopolysaccharide kinase InaA family protein [Solirubrobacterales bacterium]
MDKPPFTLRIETHSPPGRREEVVCRSLLRTVEGTREVYDATWEKRRVVVKVFMRFGKARRHALREWRGLKELEKRQISAAKPLFWGRSTEGWVVATDWLADAVTVQERYQTAGTIDDKMWLLAQVVRELARQHDRGVIQKDMHLGNFMIRGREVFALDPAMMRFSRGPIGRTKSIRRVAQLTAILPERDAAAIESVFREYAQARSWSVGPVDLEQLRTAHRRHRDKAIEQGLRKFLRVNRRHQAIRSGPWRGLADRKFAEAAGLEEITNGLDEAMTRGRILKDGRTCFVSRMKLGGTDVVVKRYNYKGLLHSLRHTLKGSRAKRCWLNANRLHLLGIATPHPLAYIDRYQGPLLRCSYFIAEFVDGQPLHRILRDRNVPEDRKQKLIDAVVRTLDQMARHGISHGDLKHTNILCRNDVVILIDLDDMQVHRVSWLRQYRFGRDKARFLRDLREVGEKAPSA